MKLTAKCQEIPAPDYELHGFELGCDSLLLHLGWEEHLRSALCYGDSPYFSAALQERLIGTSGAPCRVLAW